MSTSILFPVYDRGEMPLVTVPDLKREIEEIVAMGKELPFMAFVSGLGTNLRVEFNDYDADQHKGIVSSGLMELIKRGADRVVIVAEVWFRDRDGIPTWHGVVLIEATDDGDAISTAPFEGRNELGAWSLSQGSESGNLANLFSRAKADGDNEP